jgi:hypothetical protein
MNGLQVREQIVSFLLQNIDQQAKVIEELQKSVAEKDKKIAELEAKPKAE